MPFIILGLLLLIAVTVLPQVWVQWVLRRHSSPRPEFPGTGGEFARYLLDGMKLGHVKVEQTDQGDHYDPQTKTVRLTSEKFGGKSLTAIVVAAHEVGHAMQDATGYGPLKTRTQLAHWSQFAHRAGLALIVAAPIAGALLHHPLGAGLSLAAGVLVNASVVVMQAITLPVEFDASFNRALPVLKAGKFIPERDMPAARHILSAAAYTYVAAALMSILNIARWIRR